MSASDRNQQIAATLRDADTALTAHGLGDAEHGYQQAALLAGSERDYPARGLALCGIAQVARERGQQASAAVLLADATACFLAGGDEPAASRTLAAVTELATDPRALVVHRAVAFARTLADGQEPAAFERAGDEVMRLLKGAAAEPVMDAALSLCTQALTVERADLCARWLFTASGALRALAARGQDARLSRAADLLSRALGAADPHAEWAAALADLGAELGDRALDELRRLRAHLLRARLMVEAGRAALALPSAKAAFVLARSALGDEDPVTREALALRTAALDAAPLARA